MADRWLRLTHLYYIKDKRGRKVRFKPWPEQEELFRGMHFLNCILKARQRGMTTMVQLFMLDRCLFTKNQNAGIVAQSREDAQSFFDDKIKFAFDNLYPPLHDRLTAKTDNKNELKFSNGSKIRVGTSLRSSTMQMLHVSEFGKICAKYPDKAKEIVTGAINTVDAGQLIFIESTAEGAHGAFFDLCKRSEDQALAGDTLTPLDYKFWFFPWWRAPEYTLNEAVVMEPEDEKYFQKLADEHDIHLTQEQKNWYVKKANVQGEDMLQEYPSTPEEAFAKRIKGAVYGKKMRRVRREGRIGRVPWMSQYPCNTFWDLGRSRGNAMAVWVHQRHRAENRFIHYHEEEGGTIQTMGYHLLKLSAERGWVFGRHYLPHDAKNVDLSQGEGLTRRQVAESIGLRPTKLGSRIQMIEEGLNMARQVLDTCWFDAEECAEGIIALENYRYQWDEKRESYSKLPYHNWASNGSDAFREFAQSFRPYEYVPRVGNEGLSRAARASRRQEQADWRV